MPSIQTERADEAEIIGIQKQKAASQERRPEAKSEGAASLLQACREGEPRG